MSVDWEAISAIATAASAVVAAALGGWSAYSEMKRGRAQQQKDEERRRELAMPIFFQEIFDSSLDRQPFQTWYQVVNASTAPVANVGYYAIEFVEDSEGKVNDDLVLCHLSTVLPPGERALFNLMDDRIPIDLCIEFTDLRGVRWRRRCGRVLPEEIKVGF